MHEIVTSNPAILPEAEQYRIANLVSHWTREAQERHEKVLYQSPDRIAEQIALGLSVVAWVQGEPAGHVTAYFLGRDEEQRAWYETGTLIVPPEHRGKGIANELCMQTATLAPDSFLIPTTKDPRAKKALVAAGFSTLPYPQIPAEIRDGLCYTAPCFVRNGHPDSCIEEHNLGGYCYALVRQPFDTIQAHERTGVDSNSRTGPNTAYSYSQPAA